MSLPPVAEGFIPSIFWKKTVHLNFFVSCGGRLLFSSGLWGRKPSQSQRVALSWGFYRFSKIQGASSDEVGFL